MLTSQPIENQQRSYEVFEKKHDMECTTKHSGPSEMECPPSWMITVSVARNPVLAVSIGALNVAQKLY
jgi:hypothetical protein